MSLLQSLSTRCHPNLPSYISRGAQRSVATTSTVKTRFLLMSDTHAHPDIHGPWPKADVLLHAGDLSMDGNKAQLQATFDMLKEADAAVKVVIAGNHDMTLDESYWLNHPCNSKRLAEAQEEASAAWELWTSDEAKDAGIVYLEEGTHTISLPNGAKFTIYTSPFTPEFCEMGFAYHRDRDRFNPRKNSPSSFPLVARNVQPNSSRTRLQGSTKDGKLGFEPPEPVADWPTIDIVLTHGPPRYHMDGVWRRSGGRRRRGNSSSSNIISEPVGCVNQLAALYRARPRLSVFGHIHEGAGAELVRWQEEECSPLVLRAAADQAAGVGASDQGEVGLSSDERVAGVNHQGGWKPGHGTESLVAEPIGAAAGHAVYNFVDASSGGLKPLRWGEETLLVNAAMLTRRGQADRVPWVVDIDLHRA